MQEKRQKFYKQEEEKRSMGWEGGGVVVAGAPSME